MSSQQHTTISFFEFPSIASKWWAFTQMQLAHQHLAKVAGCSFYRLMGTGKRNGFDPRPDFSTYALLMVWENESAAKSFLNESKLINSYVSKSEKHFTLHMQNIKSHGEWSGSNPFMAVSEDDAKEAPIAVITRATIKWSKMMAFWSYVPRSEEGIHTNPGLLYTKGIGEWPIRQMATFSIWANEKAMRDFAYKEEGHLGAIRKTRELNWYDEELFSRFRPVRLTGNWNIAGLELIPDV
ncbi:MAG TPA: hypothetical protein VJ917_01410 [Saprospiraceae bacterium]|nr:hypothetical protein [Saprospiraceae bacterium]